MSHRSSLAGLAATLSSVPQARARAWMPKAGASGRGAGSGPARSAAGPAQAVRDARAALAAFQDGPTNVLVVPPDCCHGEEADALAAAADLVVVVDGAATPHALLHLLGLQPRPRPARVVRLLSAGGEAARTEAVDQARL